MIIIFIPYLYFCPFLSDARHSKGVECSDGDVRLVHGSSPHEGRVEVCVNRLWGTVCSSPYSFHWTSIESSVVCGQLGHMKRGLTSSMLVSTMIAYENLRVAKENVVISEMIILFFAHTMKTVADAVPLHNHWFVCICVGSMFYENSIQYGAGTGPVLLSDVKCNGLESRITDCTHTLFHTSSCSHYYDLGIKCEGIGATAVKLFVY